MPSLYNQALAHRFGIELREAIDSGEWSSFEFAVAWVRRTGIRHLDPPLREFLRGGGSIRGVVGVDLENTSYEGLEDLLGICSEGDGEIFVYHNEADVTFHPKLYLFSNATSARLIVGSNNMTEGGLYTNSEIGLQVDAGVNDTVVLDARSALQSWRDVSSGLSRRLDAALLADLLSEGYVVREQRLRDRIAASRRAARPAGRNQRRLFQSRRVTAPPVPPRQGDGEEVGARPPRGTRIRRSRRRVPGGRPANAVGNVLLMRVRRASETARRTQIQMPIRKMQRFFGGDFFAGMTSITHATSGETHQFRKARARNTLNTIKVEVPEIDTMNDPVMRLERTPAGITYEAFDRSSSSGRQIMNALQAGIHTTPPETMLTISDETRATMARFV